MKRRLKRILLLLCLTLGALGIYASAAEEAVCRIGTEQYESLDQAIAAAEDGAVIELLGDCTTSGMNLSKSLTIRTADETEATPRITFEGKGIALWGKTLTFEGCSLELNGIGATPYGEWGWMTVCASKDAALVLDHAAMHMDGKEAGNAHAIYFCSNNKLELKNGASLTIENYAQDALEWDGGDGGYNVNLKDSTFISDHNRSGFTGTFYATFDNSTVKVINSTGNGSNGTYFTLKNGSNVLFDRNGSWGISAWRIDMTGSSTLTATNNGYSGIWTRVLNADETSKITVTGNGTKDAGVSNNGGITFQGNGDYTSTIAEGAEVTITGNAGSGIYTKQEICNLTIGSATITGNGLGENTGAAYGGGIYNIGTLRLGAHVALYNNHARQAGDDLYSTKNAALGAVGDGWTLDGAPDCTDPITGWFEDGESLRWDAHNADAEQWHVEEVTPDEAGTLTLEGTAALKAAHGVVTLTYESNGGTAFDPERYSLHTEAELEKTPEKPGFTFRGWYLDEALTQPVTKVTMDADKTVYAKWEADKTPDLDKGDHSAYIIGYTDGTVRPHRNISRAEVATIFFRLLTEESRTANWSSHNSYPDVPDTAWYNNAVSTLSNMGIIKGDLSGNFRPNDPITRAEFAAIAARFCSDQPEGTASFRDVPETYWAAKEIAKAEQLGWIKGYSDGTFRPGKNITRAETMTLVNRVLERAVDQDGVCADMVTWIDNPNTGKWPYYEVQEATNSHEYMRTDRQPEGQSFSYEKWIQLKENRDWAALEKQWKQENETR